MSNALYASGPRDGTVIGAPFNGMPTIPLFAPEQARFDPTKLNWVGSTNRAVQTTYVWSAEPTIQTMEDINTRTFVVGSQAPGTAQNDFPVLANLLLGTRFSVVNGYESTPKIHLAMERGEVMGSAATSLSTLKVTSGDWIPDKKIRIIGQWGLKPHPELPDVPMWLAQAKSEADRQALRLLLARLEFGQPYFLPPDVPAARVAAVRRAFDSTLRDPDFLADAARAKLEVEPVTGEQVQRLIADIFATPPEVVARVRKALEAK